MRLAFRGGGTVAFELWLSSDAPLELGRNTPELDARGNSRISRCQLKTQAANENSAQPSGCLNWFVCCVETMSMCPQKISKLIKCHELN